MQAPFGKKIRKLLKDLSLAYKISAAMTTGKSVIIIRRKGEEPQVKRLIGTAKKDISEYTDDEKCEIILD